VSFTTPRRADQLTIAMEVVAYTPAEIALFFDSWEKLSDPAKYAAWNRELDADETEQLESMRSSAERALDLLAPYMEAIMQRFNLTDDRLKQIVSKTRLN
jgi:hypothetical protein